MTYSAYENFNIYDYAHEVGVLTSLLYANGFATLPEIQQALSSSHIIKNIEAGHSPALASSSCHTLLVALLNDASVSHIFSPDKTALLDTLDTLNTDWLSTWAGYIAAIISIRDDISLENVFKTVSLEELMSSAVALHGQPDEVFLTQYDAMKGRTASEDTQRDEKFYFTDSSLAGQILTGNLADNFFKNGFVVGGRGEAGRRAVLYLASVLENIEPVEIYACDIEEMPENIYETSRYMGSFPSLPMPKTTAGNTVVRAIDTTGSTHQYLASLDDNIRRRTDRRKYLPHMLCAFDIVSHLWLGEHADNITIVEVDEKEQHQAVQEVLASKDGFDRCFRINRTNEKISYPLLDEHPEMEDKSKNVFDMLAQS